MNGQPEIRLSSGKIQNRKDFNIAPVALDKTRTDSLLKFLLQSFFVRSKLTNYGSTCPFNSFLRRLINAANTSSQVQPKSQISSETKRQSANIKRRYQQIAVSGSSTCSESELLHCFPKRSRRQVNHQSSGAVSSKAPALRKFCSPIFSANANDNNDNATIFPSSQFLIDENPSADFFQDQLQLSDISRDQNFRFWKPEDTFQANRKTGPSVTRHRRVSFNTNPLSSCAAQAQDKDRPNPGQPPVDLDTLVKDIAISSNKRRFSEIKALPRALDNFDFQATVRSPKESQGTYVDDALKSPPRRIPRLLRRTQSEFCQARDLLESNYQLAKSFRHSCRRYNSCKGSSEIAQNWKKSGFPAIFKQPSDARIPPRVSSAPARVPVETGWNRPKQSHLFELNSNANATTSCKGFTEHSISLPVSFYPQGKDLIPASEEIESILPTTSSFTDAAQYSGATGYSSSNGNPKTTTSASASTPVQAGKFVRRLTNSCVCLPRITPCKITRTRDITKPGRQEKREKALAATPCSCQKLQTKGHCCELLYATGEKVTEQDIATSVHCLCRISAQEESCKFCGSQKTKYCCEKLACKGRAIQAKDLVAPGKRSPLIENRIKQFAQRQGHLQERKSQGEAKPHKVLPLPSNDLGDLTAPNSRKLNHQHFQQQQQQTSTNNHNISEEVSFRRSHSRAHKDTHCCDALCLLFGGSHGSQRSASLVFNKFLYAAGPSPKNNSKCSSLGILAPEHSEMGCFHSVSNKSKVGPCRTNIYSDVKATIDQSPTVIEEYSPIVLRYRTPYFRAHAQVIMPPIRKKETWTVGWIQACDYMKFINQYSNLGCSSWEIPALKSGKIPAVSDSDGVSYPWYGNTTEIATIVGPTDTYRKMNLTMNDNFYPSVTWDIPVSEGTNAHLTRIVRDQSFITWLAAINETTKEIIVLKTVRWNFYLEIDIDPTRELGGRARIVAPRVQKQPLITNGPCEKSQFSSPVRPRRRGLNNADNNSNSNYVGQIPMSALVRPSANNAQTLIWRPSDSHPVVVVPAKEEHRDTTELVLFNGTTAMHGKESIVKEISKQEMLQIQQLTR